jgi:hypothetical protein
LTVPPPPGPNFPSTGSTWCWRFGAADSHDAREALESGVPPEIVRKTYGEQAFAAAVAKLPRARKLPARRLDR